MAANPAWMAMDSYEGDPLDAAASPERVIQEITKCVVSPHYFIDNYCYVYDAQDTSIEGGLPKGEWVPFKLWPAQHKPLTLIHEHNQVVWLKARQLGLTWLALGYALHTLAFRDQSTVLLFSRRDTEAMEMLVRLKGMFARLPGWMIPAGSYDRKGRLTGSSGHIWTWSSGSRVMAFPTSAGDSYTATLAIVDEADIVPKLNNLLSSVKPTVDNGGKLLLISRVDKNQPVSPFKSIYMAGKRGDNGFETCFLPWYAHPRRTRAWYKDQERDSLTRTFSLDYVWEQYPATDTEALAAKQLDKRFPEEAMKRSAVYQQAPDLTQSGLAEVVAEWETLEDEPPKPSDPLPPGYTLRLAGGPVLPKGEKVKVIHTAKSPSIRGLRIYVPPRSGTRYTIGCDPAQGLPGSNNSALVVVEDATGEEVASVAGKLAPKVLARYSAELADWYSAPPESKCSVMPERNNHGHAFILWWESNRKEEEVKSRLMKGPDKAYGWNQNASTKETMWHRAAQRVTDKRVVIHSWDLYQEVLAIEAATLEAPEGMLDDLAVAWGLAIAAADLKPAPTVWTVKEYGKQAEPPAPPANTRIK